MKPGVPIARGVVFVAMLISVSIRQTSQAFGEPLALLIAVGLVANLLIVAVFLLAKRIYGRLSR